MAVTPKVLVFRLMAALIAALVVMPAVVHAEAGDISGLYFGGYFGRERNSFDTRSYEAQLAAGVAPYAAAFDDRSVRRLANFWWADGGYFFNAYIAADIAFLHWGRFEYQSTGSIAFPDKSERFYVASDLSSHGPAISVVGRIPLTNSFEFDLRLGDYLGKTESLIALSTGSASNVSRTSQTSSSLLAGAGLAYAVSAHWSLRGDYLRVNKTGNRDSGKFSADMVSAGLTFTF